jgi:hypothetical protein
MNTEMEIKRERGEKVLRDVKKKKKKKKKNSLKIKGYQCCVVCQT